MICPRCDATPLRERDHDGIVVDYCPTCRGLWLDRGELEKLIARATRDDDAGPPPYARIAPGVRRDDSPSGGYDLHEHDRYKHKRKKSWLAGLGDIFD